MRRKVIHIKLHTTGIPSHTFSKKEFVDIIPRHALPMSLADEMAGVLKEDLKKNTAQWLRELFKCQIVKWLLIVEDEDGKSMEVALPKESDDYEEILDKGVLLLLASIVSRLKIGTEDIATEWGVFSIGADGVCKEVLPVTDDEKKS